MYPPRRRQPSALDALAAATDAIRAEVEALETPLERARRVTQLLEVLKEQHGQVADMRIEPVGELRQAGWSLRRVADALELSLNAIVQIENDRRGRPRWRPQR